MKHIWELTDVNMGRFVHNPVELGKPFEVASSAYRTYFFGYNPSEEPFKFCLVSIVDGMIMAFDSSSSLINHLNADGYIPTTHKELLEVMVYLRDIHEKF